MIRRLVILLLLGALLIALYAGEPILAEMHYIVPSVPDRVLYASAFDGYLDEWETYLGRLEAQIAAGVLRIRVDDTDAGAYSAAYPYFADFDLRVTARAVDGPLNNGYGVIFRLHDRRNYYTFLVSSDGYYQVGRVLNGQFRELSTWIPSPLVRQGIGEANALRVVARGDRMRFYVNDQRVALCIPNNPAAQSTYLMETCIDGTMQDVLVDASIPNGRIGVTAQTIVGAEAGVVAEFDDLIVLGAPVDG